MRIGILEAVRAHELSRLDTAGADGDGTICDNIADSDLRVLCVEWTMKRMR